MSEPETRRKTYTSHMTFLTASIASHLSGLRTVSSQMILVTAVAAGCLLTGRTMDSHIFLIATVAAGWRLLVWTVLRHHVGIEYRVTRDKMYLCQMLAILADMEHGMSIGLPTNSLVRPTDCGIANRIEPFRIAHSQTFVADNIGPGGLIRIAEEHPFRGSRVGEK
ncbi:hypothetical protein AYO21_09528 [Fonsecaea monophora]|uniref:Uncharacterized protein n=1 Tax=Fonsecaea monophora TaxID=254056 RepID=A0A177EXE8_9EURO|nr:hypothetical protein AYO21_09528 [Fonsecaea monophora]OAG36286.1 hypothetical protein AYO21_09528 [Fonsecaea monophora]